MYNAYAQTGPLHPFGAEAISMVSKKTVKRRQRATRRNKVRASQRSGETGAILSTVPAVRHVADHSGGSPKYLVKPVPAHERPATEPGVLDRLDLTQPERDAANRFYEHWRRAGLNMWTSMTFDTVSPGGPRMPGEGPTLPEYKAACRAMGSIAAMAVESVVCHGYGLREIARSNGVSTKGAKAFISAGLRSLAIHYGYRRTTAPSEAA